MIRAGSNRLRRGLFQTFRLSSSLSHDVVRISTHDNIQIALNTLSSKAPEGVAANVLFVPGIFSSHSFWLGTKGTGLARDIVNKVQDENGGRVSSHVLDPRGHGNSTLHAPTMGSDTQWTFNDWVDDVGSAIDFLSESLPSPGGKLFLVTHSAGTAASLCALSAFPERQEKLSGVILTGCPVPNARESLFRGAMTAGGLGVNRLVGRFPARALRFGAEDEVGSVFNSWLLWNWKGKYEDRDGRDYLENVQGMKIPMLFLSCAGDVMWAPPAGCRRLFDIVAGHSDSTFITFSKEGGQADMGHAALCASSDAQKYVWPVVVDWLNRHV